MRAAIFASLLLFIVVSGAFAQATLRVGDPVQLTISGVPQDEQSQVNNVYVVDVSGSINLPYINKVKAKGRTPAELAAAVEQTYRANRIYTNPTITILMQPSARFVNVGGAVRNPGRVPFTEDMTLLTAINAARRRWVVSADRTSTPARATRVFASTPAIAPNGSRSFGPSDSVSVNGKD